MAGIRKDLAALEAQAFEALSAEAMVLSYRAVRDDDAAFWARYAVNMAQEASLIREADAASQAWKVRKAVAFSYVADVQ